MNNNKIFGISGSKIKTEKHDKSSAKANDYIAKGIALFMVGLLDEAIANYKRAIELDVHNHIAHHKKEPLNWMFTTT